MKAMQAKKYQSPPRPVAAQKTASIPATAQRKVTKITRDTNLEAREIEELTYR